MPKLSIEEILASGVLDKSNGTQAPLPTTVGQEEFEAKDTASRALAGAGSSVGSVGSVIGKGLEYLGRPQEALFGAIIDDENRSQGFLRGLTGEEDYTATDVLKTFGVEEPGWKSRAAVTVLADPLLAASFLALPSKGRLGLQAVRAVSRTKRAQQMGLRAGQLEVKARRFKDAGIIDDVIGKPKQKVFNFAKSKAKNPQQLADDIERRIAQRFKNEDLIVARKAKEEVLNMAQSVRTEAEFAALTEQTIPVETLLGKQSGGLFGVLGHMAMWIRDPQRVIPVQYKILESGYTTFEKATVRQMKILRKVLGGMKSGSEESRVLALALDGDRKAIELVTRGKLKDTLGPSYSITRKYLDNLADRLRLKKGDKLSNYFPHFWDMSPEQAAKLRKLPDIAPEVLESVAPKIAFKNLLKREGAKGYKLDAVEALEAYTLGAMRKIYVEPTLKAAVRSSKLLSTSERKYLNSLIQRLKGTSTFSDKWTAEILNKVKQSITDVTGIGFNPSFRPATTTSLTITRQFYRGLLGMNFGSAMKNATQSVNTVGKTGIMSTMWGAMKMLTRKGRIRAGKAGATETFSLEQLMEKSGHRGLVAKMDSVLFAPFQFVERMNRGIAFHAGMSMGLKRGMNLEKATMLGLETSRETQFIYGALGRAPMFQTPIGRLMGQFMTFPIKQTEFIANSSKSDFMRFVLISGWTAGVFEESLGINPENFLGFGFFPPGFTISKGLTPGGQMAVALAGSLKNSVEGNKVAAERSFSEFLDVAANMIPGKLQGERAAITYEDWIKRHGDMYDMNQNKLRKFTMQEALIKALGFTTVKDRKLKEIRQEYRSKEAEVRSEKRRLNRLYFDAKRRNDTEGMATILKEEKTIMDRLDLGPSDRLITKQLQKAVEKRQTLTREERITQSARKSTREELQKKFEGVQ